MGEQSKGFGRDLPNLNKQEFMKECYRKEDHTRLRGYLKNAKYRERQKTGEFKMITVLRDRYLGGVPKPGGYYKRVMDMKPADYRRRIPRDKDAEYIDMKIRQLNLFTDPTLHETMYPVDKTVRRQLYEGISRDGGGRVRYLIKRNDLDPDVKYRIPARTSFRHGWNLNRHIDIRDLKGPVHAHRKVIEQTFYSLNGVPGLQQNVLGEKPLM